MLEMRYLPRRAANDEWNQSKRKKSPKMKETGILRDIFTLDMEMQNFGFSQIVFGIALV